MKKAFSAVVICLIAAFCVLCACEKGHVHDAELVRHASKAATCTESGNIEYYECASCGKYFDAAQDGEEISPDDIVVAATGHSYEGAKYVSDGENGHHRLCVKCETPSETEAHDIADGVCTKCGYEKSTEHVHDPELLYHAPKAATCTEEGNIEYYECKSCGKYFDAAQDGEEISPDDIVVDALGHSYEGAKYINDGENGHHRLCVRCETPSETEEHNITDGICDKCGYSDVEYEGTAGLSFRWDDSDGHIADVQGYVGTDTDVVLPASVMRGDVEYTLRAVMINAFSAENCVKLTSVKLSDNISAIGDDAFKGQSELEWIVLGSKMASVGAAFDQDNGLKVYYNGTKYQFKEISVDQGNEFLGTGNVGFTNATVYYYADEQPTTPGRFWHYDGNGQPEIWTAVAGEEEDEVGTEGLTFEFFDTDKTASVKSYSGSKDFVYIPERVNKGDVKYTVTSIAEHAFDAVNNNAKQVKNVVIPDTVTEIGASAFVGQKLDYIILSANIQSIAYGAFGEYGDYAFNNGGKIYYLGADYYWESFTFMGFSDWSSMSAYVEAYCYSKVQPTQAGKYWHYGSDGRPLEWEEVGGGPEPEVYVTEGLTYDYDDDAETATVTGYEGEDDFVIVPSSTEHNMLGYLVTAIDDYAFSDLDLQWISFGKNIKTIGEDAFAYAFIEDDMGEGTLTVYYNGTESDWNALTPNIEGFDDPYSPVKDILDVYFFSKDETAGKFWHYNQSGLPEKWNGGEVPPSPSPEPGTGEEYDGLIFEFGDDTATVIGYTGSNKNVIIPRGVEYNMNYLLVTAIGESAFDVDEGASLIESLIIPDTVETIGDWAFNGQSLKWIVIGSGVSSIGEDAFSYVGFEGDEGPEKYDIYYNGSEEDWNELLSSFPDWDNAGVSGVRFDSILWFYSSSDPETEGNYWHYADEEKTTPSAW